jgi:hypothetical protein
MKFIVTPCAVRCFARGAGREVRSEEDERTLEHGPGSGGSDGPDESRADLVGGVRRATALAVVGGEERPPMGLAPMPARPEAGNQILFERGRSTSTAPCEPRLRALPQGNQ